MKKTILVAMIGALTLSVNAGTWSGKAPVGKAPVEECLDLGGTIGAGYHTDYLFRGVRWGRDAVTANVDYTFDGLAVPVTVGANYFNVINGDGILLGGFDKLDLFVDVAVGTFAGFDVNLNYTHYVFPEFRSAFGGNSALAGLVGGGGFGEIGLGISRSLGFADIAYSNAYAMGGLANGWFHQLGISRGFELTDSVSLVLGAGVAYTDGYWADIIGATRGSGWNHYFVGASLPIQLNCRTVLTPYISYTGAPDTWIVDGVNPLLGGAQSDVLHGGVTLSVSF
jgi:hypothetical protein